MMILLKNMELELLIKSNLLYIFREVHKLGILDIRINNCDRNE